MVIRSCENIVKGDFPRIRKDWTRLDAISPHALRAFVAAEDQLFFEHAGFDWNSIRDAITRKRKNHKRRGGSTITQQTTKNVFLWPQSTWLRKGLEVYFTLLAELMWPKQRILEIYLNIAELGPGIYGVEAASQHFFGISAQKLNRSQAALLAAVLPNPRRWSPSRPTPYIRSRQAWILRQMQWVHIPEEK